MTVLTHVLTPNAVNDHFCSLQASVCFLSFCPGFSCRSVSKAVFFTMSAPRISVEIFARVVVFFVLLEVL